MDHQNRVEVDLHSGKTITGKLDLPDITIRASATILTNILLDYVKNGGDIDNLIPRNISGRTQ